MECDGIGTGVHTMTATDYTHLIGQRVKVTFPGNRPSEMGVLTKAEPTTAIWLTTDKGQLVTFNPETIEECPEPDKPQRELPTTPGTVVRVGHHIYVRWQSAWLQIDLKDGAIGELPDDEGAEELDVPRLWREAGMDWQLLVPAPDEPPVVIDRDGDEWLHRRDNWYIGPGGDITFQELRHTLGPLTLPDGSPL